MFGLKCKNMRKVSRKTLIRQCDALCKEIVIKRDKHCVTCKMIPFLTPGHLFSRVALSTRWDLNNIFAQCATCNLIHEYNPDPLTKYYIDKFGPEAYDALHFAYSHTRPYKDWELIELRKNLKKVLENV